MQKRPTNIAEKYSCFLTQDLEIYYTRNLIGQDLEIDCQRNLTDQDLEIYYKRNLAGQDLEIYVLDKLILISNLVSIYFVGAKTSKYCRKISIFWT